MLKDEDAYLENVGYFFPSAEVGKPDDAATEPESKGLETATEPSEVLSQLPDAPKDDPVDVIDAEEPSPKKQKLDDSEDDFVVIDKEDLKGHTEDNSRLG